MEELSEALCSPGSVLATPYPQSAKYGAGNIKDAANWERGAMRTTPRHDS